MEASGQNEGDGQNGRREESKRGSVQPNGRKQSRTSGIEREQLLVDSARYLQVYDVDLIHSWTPTEFRNFVKGARLREIDNHERDSFSAIFNAVAQNTRKRNLKPKDIFDADKQRKVVESDGKKQAESIDLTRYKKMLAAKEERRLKSVKKGG